MASGNVRIDNVRQSVPPGETPITKPLMGNTLTTKDNAILFWQKEVLVLMLLMSPFKMYLVVHWVLVALRV